MRVKIITWLWNQKKTRFEYTADHVNAWFRAIRENGCNLPVAVITDFEPELFDTGIEVIPLPDDFCSGVKTKQWDESRGLPQCYRRLAIYSPAANAWLDCDAVLQIDIDCIVTGDLTPLTQTGSEIRLFRGTSAKRPYNGGLQWLVLGSRPELYNDFCLENAIEASSRFVGSDQAWLAHKLGWGEQRFDERHGVYHYSGAFVRKFRRSRPENIKILFCPGNRKFLADGSFWNETDEMREVVKIMLNKNSPVAHEIVPCAKYKVIRNFYTGGHKAKKGDIVLEPTLAQLKLGLIAKVNAKEPPADKRETKIIEPGETKKTKKRRIVAYPNNKNWDNLAARYSGATIDDNPQPGDSVFIRMTLDSKKESLKELAQRLRISGCDLLPNLQSIMLYDDKIAQKDVIGKWMPRTWIFKDRKDADEFLKTANFPIICKRSNGASSKNVSLIKNKTALRREIARGLGRDGYGYLYLQEFIETGGFDIRVNISGNYIYGKRRFIKSEMEPFASGSGKSVLLDPHNLDDRRAMQLAVEISREIGVNWMCYDFVVDKDSGKMYLLEMSCAWREDWYRDCPLYDLDLKTTGKTGNDYFDEVGRLLDV